MPIYGLYHLTELYYSCLFWSGRHGAFLTWQRHAGGTYRALTTCKKTLGFLWSGFMVLKSYII